MEISLIFFNLLITNLFFIFFLKKISNLLNLFDYPNDRKKHKKPTPLLGGVLLILSIFNLVLVSLVNTNIYLISD